MVNHVHGPVRGGHALVGHRVVVFVVGPELQRKHSLRDSNGRRRGEVRAEMHWAQGGGHVCVRVRVGVRVVQVRMIVSVGVRMSVAVHVCMRVVVVVMELVVVLEQVRGKDRVVRRERVERLKDRRLGVALGSLSLALSLGGLGKDGSGRSCRR